MLKREVELYKKQQETLLNENNPLNYFWVKTTNITVDPHFSRALPLNRRDSLLFVKNYFLEKLESPLILFYFKGKIKQEIKS